MSIKKILVSQPEPQSDRSPYFDLSEKHKLKINFRTFIKVEPIKSKEFRKDKISIAEYTAIIITSKTSVDNFFRICKEMRVEIRENLKYFCTSEAVALYLQKYIVYRKRKIFFGARTYDDLIEIALKHKKEKFLLPLSESHKPELPALLTKNKIKYSKAILFRIVSDDLSDLKNVNYDILVFFSPVSIASLFDNFPDFIQNGTKIATFGTATAKAAEKAGLKVNIKVPTKETPSMTMALDKFIKENK